MYPADFRGTATPLGPNDIAYAAAKLGCPIAIIHAFSDIESDGGGFLTTGEPVILFEAHSFHELTGGAYDDGYPNISSPEWDRSLYGAGGLHQYDRLRQALALAPDAALQSCSWGRYQVMGSNFGVCGFSNVSDMVEAFCATEAAHLAAFDAFCTRNGLVRFMTSTPPDFVNLAVGYNGAGERANGYDQKLEARFDLYAAGTPPVGGGLSIAQLQTELGVPVDGLLGPVTIKAFQLKNGLVADGVDGPLTLAAFAAATKG
jgi:hypothetical protein